MAVKSYVTYCEEQQTAQIQYTLLGQGIFATDLEPEQAGQDSWDHNLGK
jgi:hypothetical protein